MKAPWLVNALWSLASRAEARAFHRDLASVEAAQGAYLKDVLARNRESAYGRAFGFDSLAGPDAFRDRVPAADYADLEPWIRDVALGKAALTSEPVRLLEPTGGSQGGSKFIPYTASLRREFRRGLAPWIHNLFRSHPEAMGGTAYWSVSPPMTRQPPFPCRLPVGFDSDAEYLGALGRWLERLAFAVPASALRGLDTEDFFRATALHLLAPSDLAFISVWNPTFLSLLLKRILAESEDLLRALHDSGATSRARAAAAAIAEIAAAESPANGGTWSALWPRLKVISCWRDGWARRPAERLEAAFPGVAFQPKGLLATEAMVSFPFHPPEAGPGAPPCHLLAYRSHFFEFLDVEDGKTRFAWEVKAGGTYSVLVTTGGGLYRYRLRDLVRIEGFRGACPMLAFLGKEEAFSDMTGEKLQGGFVQACAETALRDSGLSSPFYLLAPEPDADPPRYAFHVCLEDAAREAGGVDRLEARMERALEENFQYALSRRLGQLDPVRVVAWDAGAEAEYYYYKNQRARLGDIKWKPLENAAPWGEILRRRSS